jgi:hypothetical protein
MCVEKITGFYGELIKPRVKKTKEEQNIRIRDKAEVFTPSWICNKQNNLIDNNWFNKENVFNIETQNGWISTTDIIVFPENKNWQQYVKANRLEISCGEAPYLASRYDTVTGEPIPIPQRIGLLDRKLRVVCENCHSETEWQKWAKKAVQSIYGYDWQGDNVLLARENLLYSYADYYEYQFSHPTGVDELIEIAKILSWNIWQMDGIKFVVPNSCFETEELIDSLFEIVRKTHPCPGCANNDHNLHNGIYCRIYNWSCKRSESFVSLIRKEDKNGKI